MPSNRMFCFKAYGFHKIISEVSEDITKSSSSRKNSN